MGCPARSFFFVVSICVVVIVASGMQQQNFCKRHPVIADFYTQEEKEVFTRNSSGTSPAASEPFSLVRYC